MRRSLITFAAVAMVLGTATPAWAAREKVNAADNALAWDSVGTYCEVFVKAYADPHKVELLCAVAGKAWVKVKVPGVDGKVTRVIANGDGDCSGRAVSWSKRGGRVTVKIVHTGVFDCTYKSVTVRYSRT